MSFGFSIGDLATLIALTKKTYDGWKDAPREYKDVVQTLSESNTLLCHVERRFDTLIATENDGAKQQEIGDLLRGCQGTISELRSVIKRRRKLGHWDRLRLGAEASHVNNCRNRLARHISILTPFLFSLELESIGKEIGSIPAILDSLPQTLSSALPAALGKMIDQRIEDSQTARGSIMTTYGDDDDKQAYRELRRYLRSFGIKDSIVRQQRSKLVEFIKTLTHDDHHTTIHDADSSPQVSQAQNVPSSSPTLVPQVVHAAEDIETVCAKMNASTTPCRRYQASAETEDEDDSMESVVAVPGNDSAATRPERAEREVGDSEHRTNVGNNTEDGARDEPEATNGANDTPCHRGSATDAAGRRKYQAYVETETEDEDHVLETLGVALCDLSISPVCPESPRKGTGGEVQHNDSSPSNFDHDTPRAKPDVKYNHESESREAVLPQDTGKLFEHSSGETKPGHHLRNVRWPAKPKTPSTIAVCGDLEYQKCFESSSDSDGNDSVATRASYDSCCSLCDKQSNPERKDLRKHLDVQSDFEKRSAPEIDDQASKIAHSGGTDVEEESSQRHSQNRSPRRSRKSGKRTRHNDNLDNHPSSSSPSVSVPVQDSGRAAPPPQLTIDYEPLDVNKEHLLTIQLQTPESGRTVRNARLQNQCAPETWRQYCELIRPSPYKDPKEPHRSPKCYHGFPGAPLPGGRTAARCDCKVVYWTPALQDSNPRFVQDLRNWVYSFG
jgi:hypothetical protein